jgi:hypothetical protein
VELHEFHVLEGNPRAIRGHDAVAGVGGRIRGDLERLPVSSGAEEDRLAADDLQLPGVDVHRDHTPADAVLDDEAEHVPLGVEPELAALLVGLLEEGVEQGVTGPVGGEAGPKVGVTTEGSLVDLLLVVPREGTAPVFHLVDGARGVVAEDLDRVLVAQEVRTLDGVVDVVLDGVPIHVAECRGHAPLGRARVAAARVELADDGHVEIAGQLQRSPQSREPGSYDDDVV